MTYPSKFLELVDQFINLANQLADEVNDGEISAAILFAAGRYNAFNFLLHNGVEQDRMTAIEFYTSEYRKSLIENLEGAVGPVIRSDG